MFCCWIISKHWPIKSILSTRAPTTLFLRMLNFSILFSPFPQSNIQFSRRKSDIFQHSTVWEAQSYRRSSNTRNKSLSVNTYSQVVYSILRTHICCSEITHIIHLHTFTQSLFTRVLQNCLDVCRWVCACACLIKNKMGNICILLWGQSNDNFSYLIYILYNIGIFSIYVINKG